MDARSGRSLRALALQEPRPRRTLIQIGALTFLALSRDAPRGFQEVLRSEPHAGVGVNVAEIDSSLATDHVDGRHGSQLGLAERRERPRQLEGDAEPTNGLRFNVGKQRNRDILVLAFRLEEILGGVRTDAEDLESQLFEFGQDFTQLDQLPNAGRSPRSSIEHQGSRFLRDRCTEIEVFPFRGFQRQRWHLRAHGKRLHIFRRVGGKSGVGCGGQGNLYGDRSGRVGRSLKSAPFALARATP